MIGAFNDHLDLPQLLVAAFVLFFFCLVVYIQRESKREGYPLEEAIPTTGHRIVGFPEPPPPKTYRLLEGGISVLPQEYERRVLKAMPRGFAPGDPLYPIGDPLIAGIGPSSFAMRRDTPFVMHDGSLTVAPLREATEYTCVDPDLDPRGMKVLGKDYLPAGVAVDNWFDKESKILRYVEVALDGVAEHRLVPIFYMHIDARRKEIVVDCLKAAQLAKAPILRKPNEITAREEDMVNGFFAGGYIYSEPKKEALL